MLTYDELKTKPGKFLLLTSLTPDEFESLLAAFERAYLKKYLASKTMTGKTRTRKTGEGRKGALDSTRQKLLFALVYQKGYLLQSIMGELFGISQGRVNEWIHRLVPVLKQALDDLEVLPERDPKKFKAKEENQKDTVDSIIDSTERHRQKSKRLKNRFYTTVAAYGGHSGGNFSHHRMDGERTGKVISSFISSNHCND